MSFKRENFKRIAENRTNKIIDMISLLGNLSNKSYYEYDNEDIVKIFQAIEEAINNEKEKFNLYKKKRKFKL